jgi:hypothetical protein
MARHRAVAMAWSLLFTASPAIAADIALRTGDHPGYGRLVFNLPAETEAHVAQSGDRVVVQFTPPTHPAAGPRGARNLRGLEILPDGAALTLAPRTRLRQARLGDRLLLDLMDAETTVAPALATARPRSVAAGILPDARERATQGAGEAATQETPLPPVATPKLPLPASIATAPTRLPATLPPGLAPLFRPADAPPAAITTLGSMARITGRTIILPFSAGTAAAAFRRGDTALVVFDERKPIDMSALRADPLFASASVSLLTAGTVLRLTLPHGEALRLARVEAGWTIGIVPADQPSPTLRPIRPETADGRMNFTAETPGRVVAVPDPASGGVLLVGTQGQPGQGLPVERRVPEFTLLATWQGVAVLPASDTLSLRAVPQGFVLAGEAGAALALSAPDDDILALSDASALSRRFDFPPVPLEGLLRRAQAATVTAATAPLQSRTALRLGVAQAMIALGMGVEAQSVMALAGIEDGRVSTNADAIGLSAIAALLAGRTAEADGLDDPRLTGSDEISMWRAVRAAMREEGSPQAAPVFAATLKLLRSYPQPLRDRLSPLVAETMALGGERPAAAAALASWKDQPGLDLARAIVAEATDKQAALAIYDRLSENADRRLRARATSRAAELRLAIGAATPEQTADALDRALYAWRGDEREMAARLRIADLRSTIGQPRRAIALLRETLQFWPDNADPLHAALTTAFARAVTGPGADTLPPLELVALAEENPDLLPAGEDGRTLATLLANRLLALDLPSRAIPVLETLAMAAPVGEAARAELGSRLAQARLQAHDNEGALAALSTSMMPGPMPADLLQDRTLTYARAAAATGQLESAQMALAALGTPAARELRASLLEAGRDWKGAASALNAIAATLPPEGALNDDQSRLLLRLAGAAAQDGDESLLATLRSRHIARMAPGATAEMFRLVTAPPVRGVSDLPRARQEIVLARGVADAATAGKRPLP